MEYMILIPAIFVVGAVIGYWLASHIHSVAEKAASAVTRATTISNSDVAMLNGLVKGLGDATQNLANATGAQANAIVAKAAAATPQS